MPGKIVISNIVRNLLKESTGAKQVSHSASPAYRRQASFEMTRLEWYNFLNQKLNLKAQPQPIN